MQSPRRAGSQQMTAGTFLRLTLFFLERDEFGFCNRGDGSMQSREAT